MGTGRGMKKALIVATAGGFAIRFEKNNIELLKGMGYEVHYAADFNNRVYEFQDDFWGKNNIKIHNVDFVKKPFDIWGNFKAYGQLKRIIEKEKFQLVHCHTPIAAALTRMVTSRKPDIKVIYTAHGFHFYKGAPFSSNIYKAAEKILSRYTDVLVTINSEDFEQAKKFVYKPGGYASYIPGVGIDLNKFVRHAGAIRENNNEFRIVSVGELNDNKNHINVIRAIAILNNKKVKYDIYGKGPLEEKLQQTIQLYKLESQVKLRGYCDDTCSMLNEADCFVFPSIREGLGMAAIEALACGLPVIALEQRGSREFLQNGKNGYFCENSPREFAKAINKVMLLSQNEYEKMSEFAMNSVKKFNEKKTVEIMKKIYSGIDSKIHGV